MTADGEQMKLFPDQLVPGALLLDEQIEALVNTSDLIHPKTFDARGLDAVSYDVRIGDKAVIGGAGNVIDLSQTRLDLTPGGYAAVVSFEKVKIPDNIVVRINPKRSFSYKGVALLTGTQIDPGYEGHLLFGFYNASSKKVSLGKGSPICSLIFEVLSGSVSKPKGRDQFLYEGDFPEDFIDFMANMEVLSWQQLSENVKQIENITSQILELRQKYENVVEPIKELTGNVNSLSQDVDKLQDGLRSLGQSVEKNSGMIQELTKEMRTLVGQVSSVQQNTNLHGEQIKTQESKIESISKSYNTFSVLVYIFWAILLVVLGGVLSTYVLPKLFSG